jgi:hypothetical protein
MTTSYSGGCACGAVRYQTDTASIFENHCQCVDCRRRSGTGHGSWLTFPQRSQVQITGKAQEWQVAGDSGALKSHGFCPVCGVPVYLTFAAMPDLFTIAAGSLDAPQVFQPKVVSYAFRGCAWDVMDPTLASFAKMPS